MALNMSARLYGKDDLRLVETPIPEPGQDEVLVQLAFCGICGTDVHFYEWGALDRYILKDSVTLGHEMSAVVHKLGPGVTNVQVGDKVAVNPNRPCYKCYYCNRGKRNICEFLRVAGLPHIDGGFSRYMVTPASTCIKLPDHISLQAGACVEPLSISVNGFNRIQFIPGDSVLVIGAGPIGLFAMQVAKAKGASKVMITDLIPSRLEVASKLGADITYKGSSFKDTVAVAEAYKKELGCEPELIIECSGVNGAVDASILTCKPGGTVLILGIGEMQMNTHIGTAAIREINIIGAVCNNNDFEECVELLASGKVNATAVITHVLPLEKVFDALALVKNGKDSIKVMLDCQK